MGRTFFLYRRNKFRYATRSNNFNKVRNDRDKLKNFTQEQHKIRNEYRSKMNKKVSKISEKEFKEQLEGMKQAFIAIAGGKTAIKKEK